jgi:hypothetical protein
MKRKNSFFLIGMTSVLLAFAMIGCDNGTSNGGSNTPTSPYTPTPQPGSGLTTEQELGLAIVTGAPGTYRIVSTFGLTSDLTVNEGQHIVVGGTSADGGQSFSAGGPLFNATGTNNTFNIGAKLKLKSGSSLTIAHGAAVNAVSGGELHVLSGAAVGVGVDVSGKGENIGTSGLSSLHAVGGASLYFENGATLAVTNDPTASKVKLETPTSAITLETGATLAIAGTGTDAAKVIGGSSNVVIEIPATAPAAIGSVEVTVEGPSAEAEAIKTAVTGNIANAVKGSPSKTTATASEIDGLFAGTAEVAAATKVTYTGSTALGTVSIPANKTLIITDVVADGSNAITVGNGAALEIAEGASISGTITITDADEPATKGTLTNNGTISTETDITLLASLGTGTIKLIGTSTAADAEITLSTQKLEIDTSGVLDLATFGISPISKVTNKGKITTAVTGAESGAKLAALLPIGGTIEASEAEISVAAGTTLVIPTGTELKLTSEASVTGAAGATIVVQGSGKITGAENFYFSNGTTQITGTIPTGTYNWDSTLDDDGGWKAATGTAPPDAKTATTPAEVANFLADPYVTQVTYTGSDPLAGDSNTAFDVPSGKTLIITGNIENQAQKIEGEGTVENNATITTATSEITEDILSNLVSFGGNGTIVLAANGVSLSETLELSQNLEIGAGGKITYSGSATDAFSTAASKTVTISGTGKLDLGSTITSLGVPVTNGGSAADAITTAIATVGTDFNAILAVGGKITASSITVGDSSAATAALNVPDNTQLTITTLTVNHANSVLTVTLGSEASTLTTGAISNAGTIKAAALSTVLGLNGITGNISVTGAAFTISEATLIPENVTLVIPNGQELTVSAAITATGSGSGTVTNNGTINTATDDEDVLRALVEFTTTSTGTVVLNGADADNKAEVTLTSTALALTTQDLVIGEYATLDVATYGFSGSKTVTNNGTIYTGNEAALTTVLAKVTSGIVEVTTTGFTLTNDATVPGGVTLTLAENTTLTVPSTKTLTLGASGTAENAATLTLTDDSSQLVLQAGGKVNAANAGSTITAATVGVVDTTTPANTSASVTNTSTPFKIKAVASSGSPVDGNVIVGDLNLAVASGVITPTQLSGTGNAIGSLEADENTTITFAGASS